MNELIFASVHKANTIKKSKRETLVKLTTNEWYGVKSRTKFKKQFENQNINLSTTGPGTKFVFTGNGPQCVLTDPGQK